MAARAIVRYSLDGDTGINNGPALRTILVEEGFQNIGTATWEALREEDPDPSRLLASVGRVIDRLRNLEGRVTLDHLWIYIDEIPSRL